MYIYAMTRFASSASATQMSHDRQIAYWLFTLAGFVVMMVLVGGLTRLTDSGLSITEWEPIRGAIPPLSDAAWQIAFEKYQKIPEFTLVNFAMTLAEFKVIYWWEWAHRFLGRIVGLVFLLPFLVFLAQGKIARHRIVPLLALFALGGLQGFMGWYMVSSGLSERVDVSQYRLAAHLGLALIIFGCSIWLALSYLRGAGGHMVAGARVAAGGLIVGLLFLQSILGALVAGIDAGMTYNDWPFMDGDLLPSGLLAQEPLVRNFFENHMTVQFDHRLLAYVLTAIIAWHIYWVLRTDTRERVRQTALLLGGGVVLQVILGIVALMLVLPMSLAAAHQIGAVIVLGIAVTHLHFLRHN
jgi:cytochrome c oxidase assembly protein subunit 15